MSTHTNENDPALPQTPFINQNNEIVVGGHYYGFSTGLTAREHAAIHLRVPMSGNEWLDAMITDARRWDAAQAAMPSYYDQDRAACISNAVHDANALTRQMKGGRTMKDTFRLWAHQDMASGEIVWGCTPEQQRKDASFGMAYGQKLVKLECRIVQPKRKPKPGKYPNDNFGLPAGYTPHNPDGLTREQIGKGFRLLATVEIGCHRSFSNDTQAWQTAHWDDTGWCGALPHVTYRVPINTPLDINPKLK